MSNFDKIWRFHQNLAAISVYMNFMMKSRQLKCFERNQWIAVWEFKHPPLHNNHCKSIETPDSHTWLRGVKIGVKLFIKEHFLKAAFPCNISCFIVHLNDSYPGMLEGGRQGGHIIPTQYYSPTQIFRPWDMPELSDISWKCSTLYCLINM